MSVDDQITKEAKVVFYSSKKWESWGSEMLLKYKSKSTDGDTEESSSLLLIVHLGGSRAQWCKIQIIDRMHYNWNKEPVLKMWGVDICVKLSEK